MSSAPPLTIRRAGADELDAVVSLAGTALGWDPDRPNAELFTWKHLENPFGASPLWVAESGGALVGFRCVLRWRFRRTDGSVARAARMVDTATHPEHQGRGIFTALTTHALEELRAEGVDFVFNTPNDRSRPGYLKMGWRVVGRVPVVVRPSGPMSVVRTAQARTAAEKWSEASAAGRPASEVLADEEALDALLERVAPPPGLLTDRDSELLAWRYRLPALHYRALTVGDEVADGVAVFRVRRRGAAREATLAELLVPDGDRRRAAWLAREVGRCSGADYVIATGGHHLASAGFVPLPRQGPILTWRAVNQTAMPDLGSWRLALGDVELF